MALLFGIFLLPLLAATTIICLTLFFVTRKRIYWIILACGYALLLLAFGIIATLVNLRTPIKLTKEVIIGDYRIDTSFYPGANASWQYNRFRFTITNKDSIYFYIIKNKKVQKIYRSSLQYSTSPPFLWNLNEHHDFELLQLQPVLYRSHKRFYYVIYSRRYGNMFFRKQVYQ